ncbi:hypothetical protein [Candidatus Frankia alpina]|uniref:hypothetical protein n=1 Tax=Candidatus Frankia alpina TaxID=2699483 RepID=UPI001F3D5A11|nr:hypothetical protein [Candidatus Frankia alpina]
MPVPVAEVDVAYVRFSARQPAPSVVHDDTPAGSSARMRVVRPAESVVKVEVVFEPGSTTWLAYQVVTPPTAWATKTVFEPSMSVWVNWVAESLVRVLPSTASSPTPV